MKALLMISILTLLSLNSFASLNDPKFDRKAAAKLAKHSREAYLFEKIYDAARSGYCNVDLKPSEIITETELTIIRSNGYEVTSDEKGGYLIIWCD